MAARERRKALEKQVLRASAQAAPLVGNREAAARSQHSVGLCQRITGVADIGQGVSHRDQVEGLRLENEPLGRHS